MTGTRLPWRVKRAIGELFRQKSVVQVITIVIALVFLVMGAFGTYGLVVLPTLNTMKAMHWEPVECRILSSSVYQGYMDSNGQRDSRVDIAFRYEYAGREWTSGQYQFCPLSSNLGFSEKAAIVARYPPGASGTCYVNPANPSDAVMERRITPEVVFSLAFLGIGLIGADVLFCSLLRLFTVCACKQTSGPPWTWRTDWAQGRLSYSSRGAMRRAWFRAALWSLASVPLSVFLVEALRDNAPKDVAPALLIPVTAAVLLCLAVYHTRRWLAFGTSVLELTTVPACIGGRLNGTIRVERPLNAKSATLRLFCVERKTDNRPSLSWGDPATSNGAQVRTEMLQMVEWTVQVRDGNLLSVSVDIPVGAAETSALTESDGVFWCLNATVEAPSPTYNSYFIVPIFLVSTPVR